MSCPNAKLLRHTFVPALWFQHYPFVGEIFKFFQFFIHGFWLQICVSFKRLEVSSVHPPLILQGMLGSGRAHIAEVCDLARANVKDGVPSAALEAFASLGCHGRHAANQERDLHRWLTRIYGMNLSTYRVTMDLTVSRYRLCNFCFFSKAKTIWTWVWLISSCGLLKAGYDKEPVPIEVPFLLPHEVLNAVYEAGPMQALVFKTHRIVLVGFWKHSISISFFPKTFASNPAVCNFYDWTPKHKKHCWVLAPC